MKKIMFDDHYRLTGLVLEGYKTKTRRTIPKRTWSKIAIFQEEYYNATLDFLGGKELIEAYFVNNPKDLPYKPGEIVAVAQSYKSICESNLVDKCFLSILVESSKGWSNKMFVKPELMPRKIRMLDFYNNDYYIDDDYTMDHDWDEAFGVAEYNV